MTTHPNRPKARLTLLSLVVVVVAACPAQREGISRDALSKRLDTKDPSVAFPSTSALLARRAPPMPSMPATLSGSPLEQAFARGEAVSGESEEALTLRCLRADARRDYAEAIDSCAAAAEAQPQSVIAPIVLSVATRHLPHMPTTLRDTLVQRSAPLMARCKKARGAGSCAMLGLVTGEIGRTTQVSPALLSQAEVDGPWVDAQHAFAGSARAQEPMTASPLRTTWQLTHSDGRLIPAASYNGWYKLNIRANANTTSPSTFFINTPEPFELRVDGTLIAARAPGEDGAEWQRATLTVNKGSHHIEVLLFDRGGGISMYAFNDDGDNTFTTVETKKWSKPAGVKPRTGDLGVNSLPLPPTLNGADAHSLVTLLLRQQGQLSGLGAHPDTVIETSAQLISLFGWSPVALTLGATGVEASRLPEKTIRALTQPYWQRVGAAWPDSPLPKLFIARAARDEQPEIAVQRYRDVIDTAPGYTLGRRELVQELMSRQLLDEALAQSDKLLVDNAPEASVNTALPVLREAGQLGRVNSLLVDRVKAAGGEPWYARRMEGGDDKAVVRDVLAGDLSVISTSGPTPLLDLFELCCTDEARTVMQRALAVRPLDFDLKLRTATLSADVGAVDAVLTDTASMHALLLRRALAGAVGGPAFWHDTLRRGDDAISARRAARTPPFLEQAMVGLLVQYERHFARDGSMFMLRHWVMELRSKDALDAFGELHRNPGEVIVRLRVVKPDGTELEPEHHAEVSDISLTGLAPGDIVEWASIATAGSDGPTWETLSFQGTPAVVSRRVLLTWPNSLEERRALTLVADNGAPAPRRGSDGERQWALFEQENVGELRDEPFSAPATEDEQQVGFLLDMNDDAHRRRAWMRVLAKKGDRWVHDAGAHLAGRGTDEQRLARLYQYVTSQIIEAGDGDAVTTLATGSGPRLSLFRELAVGAGLSVRVLAVHTPMAPSLRVPTGRSWGLFVLAVDTGGDAPVIVSDLDGGLLLGRLPRSFIGARTMDVDSGVVADVPDSAIDNSPVELKIELVLNEEAGALQGLVALALPAAIAEPLRGNIKGAPPEQLARLIEATLQASLPGAVAQAVELPGLDAHGGPMALVGDVTVPLGDDGTTRFPHLFSEGVGAPLRISVPLSAYLATSARQRTLLMLPSSERLELVIHLPQRVSVIELPPTQELQAGPVRLRQRAQAGDGRVVFERDIITETARISKQEWPTLRTALAPVIAAADAQLAFVTAAP